MLTLTPRLGAAQGTPTDSDCKPSPITSSKIAFPEVQGKSDHQELWALLFPYHLPIWVGDDIKIVWRMTGNGNFSMKGQYSDGTTVSPIWGPEAHDGSSWERPGQEWGTGFNFPKAGCWRILVTYGTDIGELDLLVIARQVIVI